MVHALLAAGAYIEAKDEVGGGATGGAEAGWHVYESLSSKLRCLCADRFHAPHCGQQYGPSRGGACPVGSGRRQGGQGQGGWWGLLGGRMCSPGAHDAVAGLCTGGQDGPDDGLEGGPPRGDAGAQGGRGQALVTGMLG